MITRSTTQSIMGYKRTRHATKSKK